MRRGWRNAYRILVFAGLAILALAILRRVAQGPRIQTFSEPELSSPAMRDYVVQSTGWVERDGALCLPPNTRGVRTYKIPLGSSFDPFLTLRFDKPEGGFNVVHLSYPDQREDVPSARVQRQWKDDNFDWVGRDLGDIVRGPGFFFVTLDASRPPGGAAPEPYVHQFLVTLQPKAVPIHWGAAIFFLALISVAYAALMFVVLPEAAHGAAFARQAASRLRRPYGVIVWAGLLLGAIAVLAQPDQDSTLSEWWEGKKFDDRAALGNAALLYETGFDVSQTYFRSRIRPGLTAWLAPWAGLLPHRLASATYAPSDKKERMFYFYDRSGTEFDGRVYWEMSVFLALAALVALLAVGGMAGRMGMNPLGAAAMAAISAVFFARCLYNSISNSANLLTTMAAAIAGTAAWHNGRSWVLAWSGILMGFAIATKETIIILITAVFLFQIWTWRRPCPGAKPPRMFQFLLYWMLAAAPCLIYYGLVLDTGLAELPENHALLRYHMEFHHYDPITVISAFKTYWAAFGLGLPLAAVGLIRALSWRRRTDADRIFLLWFAGSLWTLSMPFLFTRFLVFSIPPFAYLATRGAEGLWILARHAARPAKIR